MEIIRRAIAAPPRRRQADITASSTSSTFSTSPTSASAETTSASSEASVASDTASITPSASLSGLVTTSSAGPDGPSTIVSLVTEPPWTTTVSTPYLAPGVNATSKSTSTHSSTSSRTSQSSTTSTSMSISTSTFVDPAAEAVAAAKRPGIPTNELTACRINDSTPNAGPFCSPKQDQNLWVGFTYAITWNSEHFASDVSNTLQLNYNDTTLGSAWTSEPVSNIQGYLNIEMSKDWLKGASGNDSDLGQNMTLSVISQSKDGENITKSGPQISLVLDPHTLPRVPIHSISKKYGLEIGLPVGLVGFLLVLLGICCGIRKNNRHHRSIRGVSKDYMAKRARKRGKGGDIALEDYGVDQYTDQPLKGGGPRTGNAFRDEVARQRAEDDSSLRRFPSSY